MFAVLSILVAMPRVIAEGVWWLGRRDSGRTREEQMAEIGRFTWAAPLQWPIGYTYFAIGFAVVLLVAGAALSQP